MTQKKILIIGTIPPPIGGVSIHVARLLESLKQAEYPHSFFDLKRNSFIKAISLFFKSKLIHLHTSNVYLRVLFTLIGKVFRKKVFLTIHGNLGRFNKHKNYFDNLSVKFASIPITINKQSFQKGKSLNRSCVLIPAFIPPFKEEELENELIRQIVALKSDYEVVFCTNAGNLSYDKYGNEIYQVIMLIKIFGTLDKRALIISDPSGNYLKHVKDTHQKITDNILFISRPHSFYEVLKLSHAFLRVTTTDGDSLSVKEAMFLGKDVIATNVVDRAPGVIVVENNFNSVQKIISSHVPGNNSQYMLENGAEVLINLYKLWNN